jgi:hypothetical protein
LEMTESAIVAIALFGCLFFAIVALFPGLPVSRGDTTFHVQPLKRPLRLTLGVLAMVFLLIAMGYLVGLLPIQRVGIATTPSPSNRVEPAASPSFASEVPPSIPPTGEGGSTPSASPTSVVTPTASPSAASVGCEYRELHAEPGETKSFDVSLAEGCVALVRGYRVDGQPGVARALRGPLETEVAVTDGEIDIGASALVRGLFCGYLLEAKSRGYDLITVQPLSEWQPCPPIPTPSPDVQACRTHQELNVPGDSNTGVEFTAEESAEYLVSYVSGAYAVYPPGSGERDGRIWLTSVMAFKGHPTWDGERIRNEDAYIHVAFTGNSPESADGYWRTREEAESAADSATTRLTLVAGDRLVFVAVDSQSAYRDNAGNVVLLITCDSPNPEVPPAVLVSCAFEEELLGAGDVIQRLDLPPGSDYWAGYQMTLSRSIEVPAGWEVQKYSPEVHAGPYPLNRGDTASIWAPYQCRPLAP